MQVAAQFALGCDYSPNECGAGELYPKKTYLFGRFFFHLDEEEEVDEFLDVEEKVDMRDDIDEDMIVDLAEGKKVGNMKLTKN